MCSAGKATREREESIYAALSVEKTGSTVRGGGAQTRFSGTRRRVTNTENKQYNL